MKKIVLFAAIAAAFGFASCTAQAPKANMKSDTDSLAYAMGLLNSQGLDEFVKGQLGVDSAYMADFMKGLYEAINMSSDKEKAYLAGMQIGNQIGGAMFDNLNQNLYGAGSTETVSKENFLAGFIEGYKGTPKMSMNDAREFAQTRTEAIKAKALEEKYGENKTAGEQFLAENAKKEGVVTTESGLQYKVIKAGKGEIPSKTSTVKVNYKGTLIDGTEFDSSYKRNAPASFRADQVIAGWTEALTMMPVGSKWELYIPQELAYGSRETGGQIKPFSTLIFEVELLEIEKK